MTNDGRFVEMFIQWKGTKVCMDFSCPCGVAGHIDAGFVYHVRCSGCGTIYRMGTDVAVEVVDESEARSTVELIQE